MTNRRNKKRACVTIVKQDITFGITLADWFASHGYQIVLIRPVEAAFDAFEDLRPDAVFLGLVKADPPETISLQTLRRMTDTVYPPIP